MKPLTSNSPVAGKIVKALNLPNNTIGFCLRMRVGEAAVLHVESYVEKDCADRLATILKSYRLEEIENENPT
jgi:hypothetical protein